MSHGEKVQEEEIGNEKDASEKMSQSDALDPFALYDLLVITRGHWGA